MRRIFFALFSLGSLGCAVVAFHGGRQLLAEGSIFFGSPASLSDLANVTVVMCSIVASIALAWTALSHAALEQARRGRRGPLVRLARHLGTPAVRRALVATAASVVVPSVAHAHAHAAEAGPVAVRPAPIFGGLQAGSTSSLFARAAGTDIGQQDDDPASHRQAGRGGAGADPAAPPSPWDVGWGAGPPSDSWAQRDSSVYREPQSLRDSGPNQGSRDDRGGQDGRSGQAGDQGPQDDHASSAGPETGADGASTSHDSASGIQPRAQEPHSSAQRHTEAQGQSPRASRNNGPQPREKAAPSSPERRPDRHAAPSPPSQTFTTPDRSLAAPPRPFTAVDQPLTTPTRPFTAVDQPLGTQADSGEIAVTGPGSTWDIGWGACPSLSENGTASTCVAGTEAAAQARTEAPTQARAQAEAEAEAGASAASRTHIVQPGESLWDIASSELHPDASEPLVSSHVSRWFEANRAILSHPDRIYPGQALTPPEGYS